MASCCVKLFDDVCDGLAYARNILQAFLGDHLIQREGQRQQIVRRARVGFCPERIISPQSAALREFPKQCGNGGYVEPSHIIGVRPNSRASRRLQIQPTGDTRDFFRIAYDFVEARPASADHSCRRLGPCAGVRLSELPEAL